MRVEVYSGSKEDQDVDQIMCADDHFQFPIRLSGTSISSGFKKKINFSQTHITRPCNHEMLSRHISKAGTVRFFHESGYLYWMETLLKTH